MFYPLCLVIKLSTMWAALQSILLIAHLCSDILKSRDLPQLHGMEYIMPNQDSDGCLPFTLHYIKEYIRLGFNVKAALMSNWQQVLVIFSLK